MKGKLSGLSGALFGIVIIVTALIVVASASSPTASVVMMFGGQGAGRPTPKPKRTSANRRTHSTPRPRPTPSVSKANNANSATPNRNGGANSNVNNNAFPLLPTPVSNANSSNSAASSPDTDILLLKCPQSFRTSQRITFKQDGTLSEILGKQKVFVNMPGKLLGEDRITPILKEYGKVEIVQTASEADFAIKYCSWRSKGIANNLEFATLGTGGALPESVSGGTLVIIIRDPLQHVPRIIWQEEDTRIGMPDIFHARVDTNKENQWFEDLPSFDASEQLTRRFIRDLKRLRREDADILLLEDNFNNFPEGKFPEISDRRKVFVNIEGETGSKIIARLREYGRVEIVQTAREADFAVHFYHRYKNYYINEGGPIMIGGSGTMIITIRDPSQGLPRIIWRKDDTDGGMFRKGDAVDKLIERFISDLKKLRREK
jgi:hypothetical protein